MLSMEEISKAANDLHHAEREARQILPVTRQYPSMTMEDAYAIQRAWMDLKITEGRKIVGYKIGLTSRAMQAAMGIDEPDYGTLLDDMVFRDGAEIRTAEFTDPMIEVELAFVLKRDLEGENVSVEDVLEATDYVVPALELIAARSYRIDPETGYVRKIQDTIADNAASAGIIPGRRRVTPGEVDLRRVGAMLYRNGIIEETGLAAGVLDHPAHGVSWIARRFSPHGISLRAGQILLAGSFTRPVTVAAGDSIRADYGDLGVIDCRFV